MELIMTSFLSVSASWLLSVEPHCTPHASNGGIQPCYGPGAMGLNEHAPKTVSQNKYLFFSKK